MLISTPSFLVSEAQAGFVNKTHQVFWIWTVWSTISLIKMTETLKLFQVFYHHFLCFSGTYLFPQSILLFNINKIADNKHKHSSTIDYKSKRVTKNGYIFKGFLHVANEWQSYWRGLIHLNLSQVLHKGQSQVEHQGTRVGPFTG